MALRKWFKIGAGAAAGVVTLALLFQLLISTYGFEITDLTGDITCEGTINNPCISEFTVRNPTPYNVDVYSATEVKLDFSPQIKDYALFVSDGRCGATGSCACILKDGKSIGYKGWRCTDFTNQTKPVKDKAYNFRFAAYSTTKWRLVGLKNDPEQTVKWSFTASKGELDPYWNGIYLDELIINYG